MSIEGKAMNGSKSAFREVGMNTQPLSVSEEKRIEQELRAAIDTLIAGCEALDMDLAFKIFADSPAFLMMATDGSLCDYQTYLTNNVDYLMTCSEFELTTFSEEIRILNRDVAVYAWSYGAKATLKTGEQDIIDNAGASFVFRRVDDEWRVVYYHESSVAPKRVPLE
jgi:hypothetical protein